MDGVSLALTVGLGAGVTNGLFVTSMLVTGPRLERHKRLLLAAIMACLTLSAAEELVARAGLLPFAPHAIGATLTLDYLLAPLLWGYARSLVQAERPLQRRDLLHLVPFLLATLAMTPFYSLSGPEKLRILLAGLPPTARVLVLGKLLVGPTYLLAAIRLLRLARVSAGVGELGVRDGVEILWLRRALLALASVGILMVGLAVAGAAGLGLPIAGDDLGGIFIAASTFVVGAFLIRHQPAFGTRPGPRAPKYATSPLDQQKKDDGLARLSRVMEEGAPYRDPSLSLDELARLVALPPNHLSQLLNEAVGLSFYDFLSRYRVEAAKRLLADPAWARRTVLAIGHEAGFNSKASFNRAFKRLTGLTPTEYASRTDRAAGETPSPAVSLDPASRP